MKMSEFKYILPEDRISKYPPKRRGTTKLLVLDRSNGHILHKKYSDCVEYIKKGDAVVINDTKVEKRRTFFHDNKGRLFEILFLNKQKDGNWFVLIKKNKLLKDGILLTNEREQLIQVRIKEKKENGRVVELLSPFSEEEIFQKIGHTPIPPYMKRLDTKEDYERYNTVFGQNVGSVASPTASLNLTEEILKRIEEKGAKIVKVELKVGWGTFAPIKEENIEDHIIHEEEISLSKTAAIEINRVKEEGGSVWAFGTTVARLLESCANDSGMLSEFTGTTNVYIYPGYKWKVVDHLVTNFHMPDSSLILLVSSFAGKKLIKNAYQEALKNGYMFLSYGDSMLIL